MPKIGVISDSHFRPKLGYSDYFEDGRESERMAVLDEAAEAFKDCSVVVFNGDNLNSKNNDSETLKNFTAFIDRFNDKTVIINGGNHEKYGDGRSALDFLSELSSSKRVVVVRKATPQFLYGIHVTVCPYFYLSELGVKSVEEGVKKVLEKLPGGDILFVHHAISGSATVNGLTSDLFHEVVLPRDELEKRYKLVIGGHIHEPEDRGRTHIVGCTFTNEVGDSKKRVITIDTETLAVTSHWLPGRPIIKVINPTETELEALGVDSIVKVIVTQKQSPEVLDALKKVLLRFSAHVLVEQVEGERKKLHFEEGALDLSVDTLLDMYAKERNVDIVKLRAALELL